MSLLVESVRRNPQCGLRGQGPEALAKALAGDDRNQVNPIVAQAFADAPKSLQEAADRYGKIFADIQRPHRVKHAESLKAAGHWQVVDVKLPNADAEAIHRILYGPDAPADRSKLNLGAELGVSSTAQQQRLLTKVNDVRPRRSMV
jgi:hypothetical protein